MWVLPTQISGWAWPFVVAAMVLMWWVYTRRPDYWVKRMLLAMVEARREQLRMLGFTINARPSRGSGRMIFYASMVLLGVIAAGSAGVALGVLKNPPEPVVAAQPFDQTKTEIVTDGQTIYARPRPKAREAPIQHELK